MEKKTIELYRKKFDNIRHKSDSIEYWYARELMKLLDYVQWRNFENAVNKAMISCENNGNLIANHFSKINNTIEVGNGARREVEDYMLDLNCIELRPEYIYEEKGGNEQVLQEYTELPVIYIYASQHRILDNALNLMNCKKDIYQIDLDKIKQNIKKVDASEDEMIIYVDTLVNDYGSSVDECLKYVKQELNYNKSELLGTDDMSNIYLLKR